MFLRKKNRVNRKKENLLRTSLPLFSASVVGQGMNFLLVFLLPLLYSAEDIGKFFVFLAVAQILIPLVSLQSHNTVVLSRNSYVAGSNFLLSVAMASFFSVLVLIFCWLFYLFPVYFSKDFFARMLYLSPFVFVGSVYISLEQLLTYHASFKVLGTLRFIKSLSVLFTVIVAGLYVPKTEILIFAYFGGQLISVVYILWTVRNVFPKLRITINNFRFFILRYRRLLKYNTLIAVLLTMVNHSPVILLSFFLGDSVAALYGVVQRIFSAIPGALSQSISQVFFKKCSALYNAGKPILSTAKVTLRQMSGLYFFYGVIVLLLADWIFTRLIGGEWENAIVVTYILMPLIVIQTLAIPFTVLFTVLKTQKRIIWFYFGGFVLRIIFGLLIPLGLLNLDFQIALMFYAVSGVMYYLLYLKDLFWQAKSNDLNSKFVADESIKK